MIISILIISEDKLAVAELSGAVSQEEASLKVAVSVDAAREYMAMQTFDVVLADSMLGTKEAVDLLNVCWKHNPIAVGGIFNLNGKVQEEWYGKLYGAHIFSGYGAVENIKSVLKHLPEKLSTKQEKKKILFVEDLDSPRFIISAYIRALGYPNLISVVSAEEGLQELEKNPDDFFCILTDIMMPSINGIEFTKQIRKNPASKHLPVIVLTAVPSAEHLLDCVKEGATGFLAKPPTKRLLRIELEKAKRIYLTKDSPRICAPEDAFLLEEALYEKLKS